jgi:MYXO-CTERM domain-containing protein
VRTGFQSFFAVALAAALARSAHAGGNFVANGGFEQGFTGWTVTHASSGSFIAIFTGVGHSGTNFVQFLAFGTDFDRISQPLPTSAGGQYLLDFWLRSFQDTFEVGWNGATIFQHGADANPNPWTEFQIPIAATGGPTTLEFRGRGSFFLDDVSVTTVPAPGAGAGAMLGLAGIAMRRRR